MGIDSIEVANHLEQFAVNDHTVLFVGAGVGCRVGLPTWDSLLLDLADKMQAKGAVLEAELIRQRVAGGNYLGAATIVRTSNEILESEKFSFFSEEFQDDKVSAEELGKLEALVKYPKAGIITTNYDRSLFRACCAYRGDPPPTCIELGDETMRGAATRSEFTLARVHGRVELPNSLVISDDDYKKLANNTQYLDFVSRSLEYRSLLFVGFSFVDPAIRIIINTYRDAFAPNFPKKHAALVPSDATAELLDELRSVDIQPIIYSVNEGHHALWDGFRKYYDKQGRTQPELGLPAVDQGFEAASQTDLHRFLAFTYAQSKLPTGSGESLTNLVQESMVISAITSEQGLGAQRVTVIQTVRCQLKISNDEAEVLVDTSVNRLLQTKQIVKTSGDLLSVVGRPVDPSILPLETLSVDIISRLKLVYEFQLSDSEKEILPSLLEQIFLARAWDIGAAYSGAEIKPADGQITKICERLVCKEFVESDESACIKIVSAVRDLFMNPTGDQMEHLAELGRAALAVQLVLSSPRSTIFHSEVLPDIIYFDSNIILPAIVQGHPLQKGYERAVLRLIEANRNAGETTIRKFSHDFLNEIISHKKNAAMLISELGLQDRKRLTSYVLYKGSDHTNVYISGYANTLQNKDETYTYQNYLDEFAPYSTENGLMQFLEKTFGFEVVEPRYRERNNQAFTKIFDELRIGYRTSMRSDKKEVLISHEAEQICALISDQRNGRKPIFVTADAALRGIIGGSEKLAALSGAVLSNIGFIGMVDMMVGLEPDPEIHSRLIWGMHYGDTKHQIRNMLISETISEFNEGLLIQMPELLDKAMLDNEDSLRLLKASDAKSLGNARNECDAIDRIRTSYLSSYEDKIVQLRKHLGRGAVPDQ